MRTSTLSILFALVCLLTAARCPAQTITCRPPTFLKTFGSITRSESATAMVRSHDGYLYSGGFLGAQTFLQKTTFSGESIWVRAFGSDSITGFRLLQLVEDAEGMIVGCAQYQTPGAEDRGFVFRYDPAADSLLWARSIASDHPYATGILEKTPGGNFLYYQDFNPGAAIQFLDAQLEILELDRATGNIVPGFAQRYGYLFYLDRLTKMVATANGSLYGIGTVTCRHDYLPTSNRILLTRFDPTDGTPLWARLSDADTSALSDFSAPDLVADGDALVAVYHVDDDVTDWPDHANPEYTHLQKTDLEGNILWVRRYNFSGGALKLLVVPDGYVLYGALGVTKVDKNGDFLWRRTLNGGSAHLIFGILFGAAIEADSLYFTGSVKAPGFPPKQDVSFWKMYTDGSMDDACDYVSASGFQVTDVPNPVSTPILLQYALSPATAHAEQLTWSADTLPEKSLCPEYAPAGVTCPADLEVTTGYGAGGLAVNYDLPVGSSDCTCPGFTFTRTEGLDSGNVFPVGTTQVCYVAADHCGGSASCCFSVQVQEGAPEEACDTKTNGCLRYDLLSITADAEQRYSYRIRVTNTCANALIYTAVQLPDGLTAVQPANLSDYVSPGGGHYAVRNPNYSPFYSIRFQSSGNGISGGASDVFGFTLPAQSHPAYFHVLSRLESQQSYEAHLNTFHCPVTSAGQNRNAPPTGRPTEGLFFPNPTNGELFADLSRWTGQALTIRLLDARGVRMQSFEVDAGGEKQLIPLRSQLPEGLYFLEIMSASGQRTVERLVLKR